MSDFRGVFYFFHRDILSRKVVSDKPGTVQCDVCNQSTKLEFGTLSAHWGYGSKHDGERYELQLCEKCFFYALATLRKERANEFMFDENFNPSTLDGFGLK
nr:hypothetical protein [Acinetobacter towneri]